MILSSYLKNKLEQSFNDVRNVDPTYSIGAMVKTSDVMQQNVKDPWFLTLNQMTPLQTSMSALQRNPQFGGWSIVSNDRSSSRHPRTFIGPLALNGYGDNGGKTHAWAASSDGKAGGYYGHMISNRKETPTIFGLIYIPNDNSLNQNTTSSNAQTQSNTATATTNAANTGIVNFLPIAADTVNNRWIKNVLNFPPNPPSPTTTSTDINPAVTGPFINLINNGPFINLADTGNNGWLKNFPPKPPSPTSTDIGSDGNVTPTQVKTTSAMGTNIATGTTFIPNTQVQKLTRSTNYQLATIMQGLSWRR